MQKVRCYECGRSYDYDEDAFCPRCGGFNLPGHENTVRVGELTEDRRDGLSEKGHSGSFLHREFHSEERQRRRLGLDREETPPPRQAKKPASAAKNRGRAGGRKNPVVTVFVAIFVIFFVLMILFPMIIIGLLNAFI